MESDSEHEGLSSKQKGNILEKRFIELASLGSNGGLSCYTPDSDDDGIDIIVNQKGLFRPLFIQVKSRFKKNKNGFFSQDIRVSTFKSDKRFYICFFLYCVEKYDLSTIWLVPSTDFEEKAIVVHSIPSKQTLRFAANPRDTSVDQWSQYKVKKEEVGQKLLSIIGSIYPEIV